MKMIFTGKVSGEKTVLTAGARHTVKAQAGEQYGLVDEVTGLVPDGVEADRSGDDLILRKKEDDTEIRIEGFWEECQPGETQCTAVFNVVGENGQVTEAVLTQDGPVLENFTAGQSGTLAEGINNGIIWGGIAFGAGLAAIALAAGGGGGSSRYKRATEDEQKPVQPEGGQEAGKTDVSSTGSSEPGSGSSSGQVPAVTDQDGNGKADAAEASLAAAEAAVQAAEAAVQAAEAKKEAADEAAANADKDQNGLITPAEAKAVEDANTALDTAKQAAQEAVNKVPEGTEGKEGLQTRLDGLTPADVPAVTDQDGNGKADAAEASLAAAEAAVQAAEAKKEAADEAAANADKDQNGLITPAEAKAVEDANTALDTAKQAAQEAVNKVPEGTEGKEGLQTRLDGLTPADVPAVTDQDGNGKADAAEASLAAAEAAVQAAEAKKEAADEAAANADKDQNGLITPAEAKAVEDANTALDTAKQAAQEAVNKVPEGTEGKEGLQTRLDGLTPADVPAVTDQDGNGKADAAEASLAAAEAAVQAAEAKKEAADEAAANADKDQNGLITPAEAKAVEDANTALDTAKQAAQEAVNKVPEGTEGKEGLQTRLDGLTPADVPAVTDQDGNGKADAAEASLAAAEAAVQAAEAKKEAADEAAANADKDQNGLITPAEAKAVEDANTALDTAKQAAQEAVNKVPEGTEGKEGLQTRLDGLTPADVPAVTDQDGNGKADAAEASLAAAEAAVQAAEAAVQAAEAKKEAADEAAANADKDQNGLITPAEAKAVEDANTALDTAKQAAQEAVNKVPEGTEGKEGLQTRLDGLTPADVPAVTDQDGNGKADAAEASLAAAEAAVQAAEAAVQAAEAKKEAADEAAANADKDQNGLITPAEAKAVEDANTALDTAKQAAQEAVNKVPEGTEGKEGLQTRLDGLTPADVPAVTDQDGNGKADAAEASLAAAEAAVQAAEAKKEAADEAAANADKDQNGLITPAEAKAVEDANTALDTAKQAAQEAVNKVPEGTEGKEGLQTRLDGLTPADVPAVTDQDGNGKADAAEASLAAAEAAVQAAEAAVQAAEAKKEAADEAAANADKDQNGLITPAEAKAVEDANTALDTAKQAAQEAVNKVPEGTEGKEGLQTRLDGLTPADVPAVTDQDGNGKADAAEASLAAAEAAVQAAEAKKEAADEAAANADKDQNGLITPAEAKAVEDANTALDTAKQAAQEAVNKVPEGTEGKEGLQTRLDGLTPADVPAVTDQDGNGKADAAEASLAAAEAAVQAAEAKKEAADEAAANADKDQNGLITPAEAKAVEDANTALDTAKQAAQEAVNKVPEGTEGKEGLQTRLDGLTPADVPAVTDQDGNGKADAAEASLAAAEAAVQAAEAKKEAADEAAANADKDQNGLITPAEAKAVEDANTALDTAKQAAQEAVNKVPEGTEGKEGLQTRLDGLTPADVPAVTDQDGNGKADAAEASLAAAEAAVQAAEAKKEAADEAAANADKDQNGLITPAEAKAVEDANTALDTAKQAAQEAVNKVPEGTEGKEGLQTRLDGLTPADVPAVTDQDGNGKADAAEASLAAAEAAVQAAEAKKEAADEAAANADKDQNGLITPAEAKAVEDANTALDTAKQAAQEAVNKVPEGTEGKEGLQTRLDGLTPADVPAVTDQDGNGKADAAEASLAAAEAAVQAAEAKKEAADEAAANADKDQNGLITPAEAKAVEDANTALDTAKQAAQEAVNKVPEGTEGKEGLQTRLDGLTPADVPAVTDQDGNGKADAAEASLAAAEAAVQAAEAKKEAADEAAANADKDQNGLITPAEAKAVEDANTALDTAKQAAQEAVNKVPEGTEGKEGLQTRLDGLTPADVPAVTDQDGNGKADAAEASLAAAEAAVQAAEAAVQAAEAKKEAADEAAANADKDQNGLITPAEAKAVEDANTALDTAKQAAQEAVNKVPEGTEGKEGLQTRLDGLTPADVPAVTDQDGNGKADAAEASLAAAEAAVQAAEAKKEAADEAAANADKDQNGLITPAEAKAVEDANTALDTAKQAAQEAVNKVPEGTEGKEGLQTRLDGLTPADVPAVTDQDGNGKADAAEASLAAAEAAVQAAEAKKEAADEAAANADKDQNGLITPAEAKAVEDANTALDTAKQAAQEAVNKVPEGTEGKEGLQTRLDGLTPADVPAVTDQDGNGKADAAEASLAAAEAAVQAAEAKKEAADEAAANADKDQNGLITPAEAKAVEDANTALDTAKQAAQEAVNKVPEGTEGKEGLQTRLDGLTPADVPAVTDQDGNGKADAAEASLAAAEAAVQAAEAKKEAADEAAANADKDQNGLITPAEAKAVEDANTALDTAKQAAQEAVNKVPEGTEGKEGLQTRLDGLTPADVPAVTDQDGNGKADAAEASLAAAEAAVQAAEAKKEAADEAAANADKDQNGLITPAEAKAVEDANTALDTAKQAAQEAVNKVPEGTEGKEGLQTRLDGLTPADVPAVTDQDGNGKADAAEASLAAAEAAVQAAEAKKEAADEAAANADKDQNGLITPAEAKAVEDANTALDTAKQAAQEAVNKVPEGTEGKEGLQTRLDGLTPADVPAVTDQDGNGKADAAEASLAAAEAAVQAAEAKKEAADEAAANADKDQNGLITPAEAKAVEDANTALDTAKQAAQEAVNKVPEGTEGKEGLQTRLDGLTPADVPAVTDQDGNGKADAAEASLAAAEAAVQAAEAKKEAADEAAANADKDQNGLITPAEAKAVEDANTALDTAKQAAQEAVNKVPEGTEGKEGLQTRLDGLTPADVPAVTDQDGNGKADAAEASLAAAEAAVQAAEAKKEAADEAAANADKDQNGLITPAEAKAVEDANTALDTAKQAAQEAVNKVPEGTEGKEGLQTRLDGLTPADVPAVTDQDGNGKADAAEASLAAAEAAVQAAEAAVQAAEAKKEAADEAAANADKDQNGLITPAEAKAVEDANTALDTAKQAAQEAVNKVPEGTEGKEGLQTRLDGLTPADVPAVTDQDGNGKADAAEASLAAAEAAVQAAEAKKEAADEAAANADKDQNGLITPAEAKAVEDANTALDTAKQAAQEAVNKVPEGTEGKEGLQTRLDGLTPADVPAVTDQDGNGKADAAEASLAAAEAAVQAAEAKKEAADEAAANADKDQNGLITPAEAKAVEDANTALDTAKQAAQEAVNKVPEGTEGKEGLQTRLDGLTPADVPAVTDQDGNGKADAAEASLAAAEAAVQAAEAKKEAADEAAANADKDQNGLITPAEAKAVEDANTALDTAKQAAQEAVNKVPEGTEGKEGLQTRLDGLTPADVPAVTDQDGNGKADAAEASLAAAEAAVQAAEAKKEAADEAAANADKDQNGLITPAEAKAVEDANTALDTAKQAAQEAVNKVPEGTEGKEGLQTRLDGLTPADVPAVTDQDGNGKADAAEAAVAFYERALPSNVSGDLYPQPSIFGDKVSSVSKNWSTLLDSNPGSYVTSQRLDSGANQYNYNGHTGSDVISITDSFGGLDRTQVSRFPVGLFTGEGNDLIVTGRDYGRNTSAGYTDHSHRTDMGNGDDTLVVGVGNNDVTLYVNEEGQLRATTDSYNGSTSIDYTGLNSSSSGGTISGTDIVMGAGNDTVLALGYEGNSADAIINTNIDLGAGNDFIYANGEISTNNGTQVNIIGGEGFDTISLDNTTVTSAMFSGFEHVDLHSTSHLILNSDDFKSQDIEGGILKISGSSGASVDVQNFDWENVGSANDGDVKYFTYQSSDIPSLTLWIQEGIEVK
ncbi:GA-like domain-containing protein [Escherichia coli]